VAHISHIWFFDSDKKKKAMQVCLSMKPAGRHDLDVELPPEFYDTIMRIAQTAADQHEAKCVAEILASQKEQTQPTEVNNKNGKP